MLTAHGRHRYQEVDSLRGIAALVVVLQHCLTLWNRPYPRAWQWLLKSPLGLAFDGLDAVFLFFVMSGFVLFLPYNSPQGPDPYPRFVTRRICRIWLPYLFALTIAITCNAAFLSPANARFTQWVYWTEPVTWHNIWQNILLIGPANTFVFNGVFWTLQQELRLSLLFPLIAWLALKLRPTFAIAASVGLVIFGLWFGNATKNNFVETLGYFGMFLMGAVLARFHSTLVRRLRERLNVRATLLAVGALALLRFPEGLFHVSTPLVAAVHGLGAASLLLLVLSVPAIQRVLHAQPFPWLGRISYSLYLIHGIILFAAASQLWDRTTHHLLLVVASAAISFPIATLMYRYIERPAIVLGQRLTRS